MKHRLPCSSTPGRKQGQPGRCDPEEEPWASDSPVEHLCNPFLTPAHPMLKPERKTLQALRCTWASVTRLPDLAFDSTQVLRWGPGEPLHRLLHVFLPDAQGTVQAFADNFKIFNCHLQEGCC